MEKDISKYKEDLDGHLNELADVCELNEDQNYYIKELLNIETQLNREKEIYRD